MAKLSTEDLLDQFKEMTLIELSEFVKAFEEAFDVKAAAPMAMAAAIPAAAAEAAAGAAAAPPLPFAPRGSNSKPTFPSFASKDR